jgi:ABC-type protease/lipase transport system fused ATPase/permease subunit
MNLPAPKGVVSCEQVGYAVPQREQPILMGIDFTVEPGQALGIVGPSAAGKSSLCKILVGAWKPTRGHARLDGGDVSLWDPSRLGKYIGYLPQDVELFSGTVKDNIARLSPQLDEAAVIEAAMAADVHDMILALPKGYDTDIGEDGAFLSGGQRQRIGLARAFYGKPKLIVLDEPAASLDSRGEEALLRAIDTAKGWGSTVVMVAHKLRLLRSADKLLLLHEGQQQAFGPKDDIIGQLRLVRPATAADTPSLVAAKPEASG